MELKEYQKKVVNRLSEYLQALSTEKNRYERLNAVEPDLAAEFNYPKRAWETIGLRNYHSAVNGINQPLPHLYFKVPTGGGKTLLACHAVDLIHKLYLQKQHGLVLWIVPTTQIYRQTLKSLRDRHHPYRQVLDVSSGGRTMILEKLDQFNVDDVASNLCVLLLMLPSASRQTKETLKVFKDNTGYTSFFPAEDAYKLQKELLDKYPNLDTFSESDGLFGHIPKTSLGNALRMLRPITIVDEGHKAYSEMARSTIYGFNPSFVLELSATPPENTNRLVAITGRELNDEQMIKLDLHLINKNTSDWQDTMNEAVAWRAELEQKAKEYEQNTNNYIRPIMLVQVERTGKDQRDGKFIHAEDIREYLIKQCMIPNEQIAVKSSDKDEIENIDLLERGCHIRFIITKQALQEGWDCPFAYVLTALTKSQSETAMTQLIGRVLRQPYARKSGIKELDECYVYSFQHDTAKLVGGIKKNLEGEGLGDVIGRINVESDGDENPDYEPERTLRYRKQFKKFEGRVYLPVFAIESESSWRELSYETDLLGRLDWSKVDLSAIDSLSLEQRTVDDDIRALGYGASGELDMTAQQERSFESELSDEYVTRQIIDIVPNPWLAYGVARDFLIRLQKRYDKEIVASNLVYAVERLKSLLFEQRNILSEQVFRKLLKGGTLRFYLLKGASHSMIPSSITMQTRRRLTHADGEQIQASLFDYIPAESINGLEEEVALYLDRQQKLLWWYRNMAKADYRIQGWKPGRVYPDFITAAKAEDETTYDKLYVLETKGEHLLGNEDTEYKRQLLELCNEQAVEKNWQELDLGFGESDFVFQMVNEDGWKSQLSGLLANSDKA